MPSWPIHISLANKLNEKLMLNDEFILGNILPDVLDGYIFKPSNIIDKNLSHYRSHNKIDINLFLKENKNKLNNPIILGYLIHLLVDYFYNDYTSKNHFIDTEDGIYILLNDNTMVNKSDDTLAMKQDEYTKYGQMLAYNNKLGTPIKINNSTFNDINELSKFSYSEDDITKTIEIINNWIKNKFNDDTINYTLYTKEELDDIYNDCYLFLINYLDDLKETN